MGSTHDVQLGRETVYGGGMAYRTVLGDAMFRGDNTHRVTLEK